MKEIWKPVTNYEDYYLVSNLGEVKSIRKRKILKPFTNHSGYKVVSLQVNNIKKKVMVHRLVAETFIKNPNKYRVVNHKNGIKADNRESNLEWCTHSLNAKHAFKNKLRCNQGTNNSRVKLSEANVLLIYSLKKQEGPLEVAVKYNISEHQVKKIWNGSRWNHLTKHKKEQP